MKNWHQIVGTGIVFGLVSIWFGIIAGIAISIVVYYGLRAATKKM